MKLALAFFAGAAIASAGSALALSSGQSVQLKVGDNAYTPSGDFGVAKCAVVAKQGTPVFSCFVSDGDTGNDYRKAFGVTISGREVTVNQYFGPSATKPYKVIFRRTQTHIFIAH